MVEPFTPEATEAETGVPAERVRELARDIAAADGAAVYGRTGSCLGRNGTLVSFLLDALALVSGNLDRPGGAMFGEPAIPFDRVAEMIGADSYGERRSRIGDLPEVLGAMPATVMAKEITTPGPGQMRALFVSAGNPVLSVPDGEELSAAIGELDLCVAVDIYMSETAKHADYVLPATTFLEREDYPLPFLGLFTKPFINMTEAVVEPSGEARQEWEVVEDIASRVGVVPSSVLAMRLLGKVGIKLSPRRLVEMLLRLGPQGDSLRAAARRAQPQAPARAPARHRPRRRARARGPGAQGAPRGRAHRPLPGGDRRRGGGAELPLRGRRRGLPAAHDRPARAALAQLLDAQLAEADGRRSRPPRPHPSRRRERGRGGGGRAGQDHVRPR